MKDLQLSEVSWQGDGEEHSVEGYAVRLSYEHADVLMDMFEYLNGPSMVMRRSHEIRLVMCAVSSW